MHDDLTPSRLERITGLKIHPPSPVSSDGALLFMAEGGSSRLLGIWGKRSAHLDPFVGERIETGDGLLALCPLLHENAEVLHVTFDSVLRERTPEERWRFFDRLTDLLRAHPAAHAANLEAHFLRHLKPFVRHPARAGAVP